MAEIPYIEMIGEEDTDWYRERYFMGRLPNYDSFRRYGNGMSGGYGGFPTTGNGWGGASYTGKYAHRGSSWQYPPYRT